MIRKSNAFLAFVVAALVLPGCSSSKSQLQKAAAPEDEIVEAEGLAPYNSDISVCKAAALAAAQRSALEMVVGVYVNAKTRVDKAVAVENQILANVQGYVKRYQILNEGKSGDMYKVRIRALVSTKKLRQDLDSMGLLRAPAIGNPRALIVLHEWIGEKQIRNGEASRALAQGLINKGFQVVTVSTKFDPEDDPVEIARTISRKQAELIVAGLARAQSLELEKKMGGMSSYRAAVSLRVIEVGSGQILSTVSQQASGLEGTAEIAGGQALAKAAELAAADLSSLPEEIAKRSLVTMKIVGIKSFEKVSMVQKTLGSMQGVKDVFLRSFSQVDGEANLEFHVDGVSPQEAAALVVKTGGSDWSIYQVEGRTIQLSASPAGR